MKVGQITSNYKRISVCLVVVVSIHFVGCKKSSQSAIVTGGSMAPTLLGEHYWIKCDDCGFEFAIDAINAPKSKRAVCPNCGCAKIDFANKEIDSSDPARVAPTGEIYRWGLIAFENFENQQLSKLLVKRVVGLPGEQVSIVGGDIYVDGKIVVKPDETVEQISIPVFDSQCLAKDSLSKRFVKATDSLWRTNDGELTYLAESVLESIDWLSFKPIKGYRHSGERYEAATIEDSYAYNQNLARRLNPVTDLAFDLELTLEDGAILYIRFGGIEIVLRSDELVTKVGSDIQSCALNWDERRVLKFSIRNFDRQLVAIANGQKALDRPIDDVNPDDFPVQIGADRGKIKIHRFVLCRDLFYTNSTAGQEKPFLTIQLKEDEYFVLGDNCPISVDSRNWGAVKGKDIIGIVEF